MLKKTLLIIGTSLLLLNNFAVADEGMWLPLHIKRLNYEDMQKRGFKLTAEEIYSVNNSCLKDAVVSLGGFCTGEIVSGEGLMLTNHHCAFEAIQENSTTEHDYLTDGFWAMNREQELPVPGLTASFLLRMEDVTALMLKGISADITDADRSKKLTAVADSLKKAVSESGRYRVDVKPFFDGNEYYMFVYEVFKDIRLVGAPPSSIGKFGGDTDNWMWPRHTGDFGMFRVYASKDNKPADYSKDNVPYKPKYHLPVSINGVQKNDYAMIIGFPSSTDRFLTSYGVKLAIEKDQPMRVKVRGAKLDILEQDMKSSAAIRIKYASKYAQISNYWKYFQGQTAGLKRLKVYDKKKKEEEEFTAWIGQDEQRKARYGNVLTDIENAYKILDKFDVSQVYVQEGIFGVEVNSLAYRMSGLYTLLSAKEKSKEEIDKTVAGLKELSDEFFKDYNAPTDEKLLATILKMYYEDVPADQHPMVIEKIHKKYKGDFSAFAKEVFKKSVFVDKSKFEEFLKKPSKKVLDKEQVFSMMQELIAEYRAKVQDNTKSRNMQLVKANRLLVEAYLKMKPDKKFYPNANSTMRVTYGQVLDYTPKDAVHYNYYTTLDGIMEKEDPSNDEFIVPDKLKQLYKNKDYGQYGENGQMKVCFLSNTDITGGNSGSPVINGNGELIGIAFDGNWEAMSGDIAFETEYQRTISVDIRYVLFIIDKYAGAKHLIDEMTLVKGDKPTPDSKAASKVLSN